MRSVSLYEFKAGKFVIKNTTKNRNIIKRNKIEAFSNETLNKNIWEYLRFDKKNNKIIGAGNYNITFGRELVKLYESEEDIFWNKAEEHA